MLANCLHEHLRNIQLDLNRVAHPSRHGQRKKVYEIPEIVELKHRVTLQAAM